MSTDNDIPHTGAVIGRRTDERGVFVSVAITLPLETWARLTGNQAVEWLEIYDDLVMRQLRTDELIALFVSDEVDAWCSRVESVTGDLDDGVPF